MSSLIPGYQYDIFISYRQNDNRSGWVTEFVKNLQEELAATIKEPLSVYFDTNPYDGLLETHNVDKSLEGKLKCLIFIPIISQTYCDPKSFAWEHEFRAFKKIATEDAFGLQIRLSNGNVASRILPVKIHDLDNEDKVLIESETGGPLRAIEFIYKEAGVNRPLKADDSEGKNLNGTKYRNQLNKAANAVKEIIQSLKSPDKKSTTSSRPEHVSKTRRGSRQAVLLGILLFGMLSLVGYYFYPSGSELPVAPLKKSLAVLPFADMSPQKDQEWFSDGLTEELLNSLAQLPELDLIARTSSFAFKGKNIPVGKIADSLGVSYIVEGSIRKVGEQLRITAQLIQADKGTHLWSNTYDRKMDDVFSIQEDIAENIANSLNILLDDEKKAAMFSSGTRNVEAYEQYMKGLAFFEEAHGGEKALDSSLYKANIHFEKAIALDPNFAAPYKKHQDFFSHYFYHQTNIRQFLHKEVTDQEIYEQIVKDLEAAIRLEKNPNYRLAYQAERIVLSTDWSQFNTIVEKMKRERSATSSVPGGFYFDLMLITDPEFMATLSSEALRKDPLNSFMITFFSMALIGMDLPDSAARVSESYQPAVFQWHVDFRRGRYSQALEKFPNQTVSIVYPYYKVTQLLAGQYDGSRKDLIREINQQNLPAAMFYNALGEYEKADSVAHAYDSKFLGPGVLADFLLLAPLSFRLSATPNFAARLKELGVNPVEFEKKHYTRFPLVKLKK